MDSNSSSLKNDFILALYASSFLLECTAANVNLPPPKQTPILYVHKYEVAPVSLSPFILHS